MPSIDDVTQLLFRYWKPESRESFPIELEDGLARVVGPMVEGIPDGAWGIVHHGEQFAVLLISESGASLVEVDGAETSISVTHLGELPGGVYVETLIPAQGARGYLLGSFLFSHPRIPAPGVLGFQPLSGREWEEREALRTRLQSWSTGRLWSTGQARE